MSDKKKPNRRDFIFTATAAVGAVGAGAAAWPLIDQMNPSKDVEALAKIEIDLSGLAEGQSKTVLWRGKPLFIKHRSPEEINEAKNVSFKDLPDPQKDEERALNPKFLILVGVCTHLGCVPAADKGDFKGWFCPCHGSHYDTSGRIRKGPAPTNLEIPPYKYVNDNTILVG